MPINSKAKGKRGELEAVKFLKRLGFADAKRTQQFNGLGRGDVECPESLPNIHFEVKFGYSRGVLDIGTHALREACKQAARDADAGGRDSFWVVLWKPKGAQQWRVSYWDMSLGAVVTLGDDLAISNILRSVVET
jgi:hypothetical protein